MVWGSLALAVLLLLGVVWALGGFRSRQDLFTATTPGTTFTSGPYELSFSSATVQYSSGRKTYAVIAIGTGRTTGDETISPATGSDAFAFAQDLTSREVQPVDAYSYGDSTDIILRAHGFTPGLVPVRFTAKFEFTAQPGDTLRLVVFDQEFGDKSVFGDQDPAWNPVTTGHDLRLPLQRLPDRKY